jgi:hypothetical protein
MKSNECNVSLTLDRNFHKKIGVLAHKMGLSYNQFYRNLLVVAYDDAKFLDSIGLLGALSAGRAIVDEIKEKNRVKALDHGST